MQRLLDVVLRRDRLEPAIPHCSDHKVEMALRGKQGRPTRFSDQTEEEYTLIYFCPVEGCNHTAHVSRKASAVNVATGCRRPKVRVATLWRLSNDRRKPMSTGERPMSLGCRRHPA